MDGLPPLRYGFLANLGRFVRLAGSWGEDDPRTPPHDGRARCQSCRGSCRVAANGLQETACCVVAVRRAACCLDVSSQLLFITLHRLSSHAKESLAPHLPGAAKSVAKLGVKGTNRHCKIGQHPCKIGLSAWEASCKIGHQDIVINWNKAYYY